MKKSFLLSNLCFFLISVLNAQDLAGEWEKINNAQGIDQLKFFKSDDAGNLYAEANYSRNMYFSKDAGNTWEMLSKPFHPSKLSFKNVGRDGTIVYFSGNNLNSHNQMAVSKNFGGSWEYLIPPERFIDILPLKNGNLLALRADFSVFLSENTGRNWRIVYQNDIDNLLVEVEKIFELSNGTIMIPPNRFGFLGAYLVSYDSGSTWEGGNLVDELTPFDRILNITIAPNGLIWILYSNQLLNSADNGKTWEPANILNFDDELIGILFTNDGKVRIQKNTISDSNDIFHTNDDGQTWEKEDKEYFAKWLLPYPLSDGTYIGEKSGIHKSYDFNENWILADRGIFESVPDNLTWISEDTLFGSAAHGIIRSFDRAETWDYILHDTVTTRFNYKSISECVAGKQLFFNNNQFYLSTNFGNSLKKIDTPFGQILSPGTRVRCAISPEGIFIISNEFGTYTSDDSGAIWEASLDGVDLYNFKFHHSGVWFACHSGNGFFGTVRSFDLGKTWEKLDSDYHGNADLDALGNLLTWKTKHIYSSIDFGEIFTREGIEVPYGALNAVHSDSKNNRLLSYRPSDRRTIIHITFDKGMSYFPFDIVPDSAWWFDDDEPYFFIEEGFSVSPKNYIYQKGFAGLYRYSLPTNQLNPLTDTHDFSKKTNIIYPNPTQGNLTLSLPEKLNSNADFIISNNLGQKIFEQKLLKSQTTYQIDVSNLEQGIYFYSIEKDDLKNQLSSGKILIKR